MCKGISVALLPTAMPGFVRMRCMPTDAIDAISRVVSI